MFEIVAHRGVPAELPENTLPSYERAIELGADAVELDVRLTADRVPIVYHYFYLNEITSLSGSVFEFTFDQLRYAKFLSVSHSHSAKDFMIPSLTEVLETIGGRIGLEIEIKGPEPESAEIIADILSKFKHLWDTIEVTSYEPALLLDIKRRCPGLTTDLLFPRSEDWMGIDVVSYLAIQRARLANVRAVHLHPTQLAPEIVFAIRHYGLQIHAWDVNDQQSLQTAFELNIQRICTDKLQPALDFRQALHVR